MSTVYSTLQALFSGYLLPVIIFVSFVLLSYAPRWYYLLRYRLPPGPVCLPFLGYLPILNKDTGYISGIKLAEKYGNVVSVYLGRKHVVILNDYPTMKTAYNKDEFLDRPDKVLELANGQPSVLDVNGALWKEQRRFLGNCLRQLATGNKNFESIIMSLISDVCSSLITSAGTKVNLDHELELASNNVTFYLIYGKRFEVSHPMIRLLSEYNMSTLMHVVQKMLEMFFPMLSHLMEYTPRLRNARKVQARMDVLIRKEVLEHQDSLNQSEPRDIIDHFLINMNTPESSDNYNMEILLGSVKVLLSASSETIKSTLTWFFLLMAKYQDVQKRVQDEIEAHLGREREPKFSDRPHLCYTEAAILESMRLTNVAHWDVLRSVSRDTTLCGFDIPEDTVIMFNMTSQFHNPDYFDRPEEFDPTRFLTPDGKKLFVPEHFVPFSYGKRNCPGDKMATLTVFLFAITLLQRFDILPTEDGVSLEKKVIFINLAMNPYVCFKSRF